MANLAIRGHKSRGKEVIGILWILGGNNAFGHIGNNPRAIYYIDENYITCSEAKKVCDCIIFTLEEFLEKYPYKVGDKVTLDKFPCTIEGMSWDCDDVIYYVRGVDFLKGVYSKDKDLQPYKEETIEESQYKELRMPLDDDDKLATEVTINDNKILPPNGYLIGKITQMDNGMLVEYVKQQPSYPKDLPDKETNMESNKCTYCVYSVNNNHCGLRGFRSNFNVNYCSAQNVDKLPNGFELQEDGYFSWVNKKQPQYPKTYEECCKVLNSDPSKIIVLSNRKDIIHEENKHCFEMYNLYQLLICRDAYWKIAGDWKPNWNTEEDKYTIYTSRDIIVRHKGWSSNYILAFPTEEMRDAFYENFKELIELCKELL